MKISSSGDVNCPKFCFLCSYFTTFFLYNELLRGKKTSSDSVENKLQGKITRPPWGFPRTTLIKRTIYLPPAARSPAHIDCALFVAVVFEVEGDRIAPRHRPPEHPPRVHENIGAIRLRDEPIPIGLVEEFYYMVSPTWDALGCRERNSVYVALCSHIATATR